MSTVNENASTSTSIGARIRSFCTPTAKTTKTPVKKFRHFSRSGGNPCVKSTTGTPNAKSPPNRNKEMQGYKQVRTSCDHYLAEERFHLKKAMFQLCVCVCVVFFFPPAESTCMSKRAVCLYDPLQPTSSSFLVLTQSANVLQSSDPCLKKIKLNRYSHSCAWFSGGGVGGQHLHSPQGGSSYPFSPREGVMFSKL